MAANILKMVTTIPTTGNSVAGITFSGFSPAVTALSMSGGGTTQRDITLSRDLVEDEVGFMSYDSSLGNIVGPTGIPYPSFTNESITDNVISDIYTNAQGEQLIVIGPADSNGFGAAASPGPTPTAGTVKQISITTGAKTNVGATDLFDSCGTNGSSWPGFGIDYNTKTSKIPCIIDLGVSGSTWGDWVSTYYAPAKVKIDAAAAALGVVPKAIFVRLGVNNIGGVEATVSAAITSMLDTLTIDYPNTTIYLTQIGHASRIDVGISMVRKLLIAATQTYTNVRFSGTFQTIQANGYFVDNFHPDITGYTEAGKMDSRAIIANDAGYGKVASWLISTDFTDLDAGDTADCVALATALGNLIYELDCGLFLYKTKDVRNTLTDRAMRVSPVVGVAPTWTTNDSISFNGSSQYLKSGIRVDQTNIKSTVSDQFFIIRVKTNSNVAAFAYPFGAVDLSGTNSRINFIDGTNPVTNGRLNTQPGVFSNELTSQMLNNTCYGVRISGGALSMLKNGVDFGALNSSLGSLILVPLEIFIGADNQDGVPTEYMNFSALYFAGGKSSTVNQVTLYNALEAFVA